MGYVGNQTTNAYSSMDKQTITGDGGASYTLTHAVANAQEIEVFVNNVRQEAGVAYTVNGTALNMTGNVASTDDFYVIYQGKALQTIVPPDGSVSTAKLASGAVTSAKLDTNIAVSGNLDVGTIRDASGTNTAMTINSSGAVRKTGLPAFNVRGNSGATSLTAANANFDYVSTWSTTDVNQGSLLNAGGYAEVPSGWDGLYLVHWHVGWVQPNGSYNSAWLVKYDASANSYSDMIINYSSNDYEGYSTGGSVIVNLSAGDRMYAGYDDRYGAPNNSGTEHIFHMHFIG